MEIELHDGLLTLQFVVCDKAMFLCTYDTWFKVERYESVQYQV